MLAVAAEELQLDQLILEDLEDLEDLEAEELEQLATALVETELMA
tara:strand:- start:108 stop:242 length:135 start_codon:yes stop_codon:yes gene_type:complete